MKAQTTAVVSTSILPRQTRQKGGIKSKPQWRGLTLYLQGLKGKIKFLRRFLFLLAAEGKQALPTPTAPGSLKVPPPLPPLRFARTSSLLSPGLRRQDFLLLFLVVFVDFIDTPGLPACCWLAPTFSGPCHSRKPPSPRNRR